MNAVINRDLLELDDTIRNMCTNTTKRCRALTKRLTGVERRKMLTSALNSTRLKGRLSKAIRKDIQLLDEMDAMLSFQVVYVTQSTPIVREYMKMLSEPMDKVRRPEMSKKRTNLSKRYCDIVNVTTNTSQVYVDLMRCSDVTNSTKPSTNKPVATAANTLYDYKCDACGNETSFVRDSESVNCAVCGGEIIQCVDGSRPICNGSYKHSTNGAVAGGTGGNNVYNRTMHFRDCLYQYQGVHTPVLAAEVFESLIKAMRECNIMGNTGDRERDAANVTKGDVLYYLKQLNYTRHYDDAVYIHRVITGRSSDNVQHLEERLIHDFTLLSKKYDEQHAGKRERRSFINMQIVLYQLLRRYGHDCKLEDFASIKSLEQRARRDELYKELFTSLGWKYEEI
ncbi:45.4 DNA replication factor [Spodoptera frugiperda ascovirus 1a]|uniref:45.4 DNA replication factor n=1 Tax=Spodoptera frugiperda ascovirus 1a TaxID=113370 RepID=Q0E572_SFAVA|nr:45.4 DNA replication factor [Spodoptera frugiperda ascovirus 1a]CAL44629.1 45.4 DNA replication factor [Spodoptera frugiperda ascovirus 1a]